MVKLRVKFMTPRAAVLLICALFISLFAAGTCFAGSGQNAEDGLSRRLNTESFAAEFPEDQPVLAYKNLCVWSGSCIHIFEPWKVQNPAGCDADGTAVRVCRLCGCAEYRTLKATGHKYEEEILKEPSCSSKGLIRYTCRNDASHISYAFISELGHSPELVEGRAAGCTEEGMLTHYRCSVCGELFSDKACTKRLETAVIPALGHEFKTETLQEASCTQPGIVNQVCSICGETVLEKEIPPCGHSLEHIEAAPATCEENGYTEHWLCSVCGELFADEKGLDKLTKSDAVIPATGHYYIGSVTKEATCTDRGVITYICANDPSHTTTESIPALGHELSHVDSVEPTALSEGVREHWVCSRCNGYYSDPEGSYQVTAADLAVPVKAPKSLSAPVIAANSSDSGYVTITWTRNDEATGYEVYRSRESTRDFNKIADTSKPEYTDSGLAINTTYYYKVITVYQYEGQPSVRSGSSNIASGRVNSPDVMNISADIVNYVRIRQHGGEYTSPEDEMGGSADNPYQSFAKITGKEERIIEASDIRPETEQEETIDKNDTPAWSGPRNTKIVISTPKMIAADPVGPQALRISWTEDSYASNYSVYRSTYKNKGYIKVGTTLENEFTDEACNFGKTYYYKVVTNVEYNGMTFNSAEAHPISGKTLINAAGIASVTPGENGMMRISIEGAEGADYFEVYRSCGGEDFLPAGLSLDRIYEDSGTLPDTVYFYKVRAVYVSSNGKYFSAYSVALPGRTGAASGHLPDEESRRALDAKLKEQYTGRIKSVWENPR